MILGRESREWVEFVARRLVDEKAGSGSCNLILVAFVGCQLEIDKVATLTKMMRGRVPRRDS